MSHNQTIKAALTQAQKKANFSYTIPNQKDLINWPLNSIPFPDEFKKSILSNLDLFNNSTVFGLYMALWFYQDYSVSPSAIRRQLKIKKQTFSKIKKAFISRNLIKELSDPNSNRIKVMLTVDPQGSPVSPGTSTGPRHTSVTVDPQGSPVRPTVDPQGSPVNDRGALGVPGGPLVVDVALSIPVNNTSTAQQRHNPAHREPTLQDIEQALALAWPECLRASRWLSHALFFPAMREALHGFDGDGIHLSPASSIEEARDRLAGAVWFWLANVRIGSRVNNVPGIVRDAVRKGYMGGPEKYTPKIESQGAKPKTAPAVEVVDPLLTASADDFVESARQVAPLFTTAAFFDQWGKAYADNPAWSEAVQRIEALIETDQIQFKKVKGGAA